MNVNKSLLNQAIKNVKTLIEDFRASTEDEQSINKDNFSRLIFKADFGSLALSREDVEKQEQVISMLHNAVKGKVGEKWSRKGIDKLLQNAIFLALDISQTSSNQFTQRLESAIQQLKSSLIEPLKSWEFYYVILGLDVNNGERKIGNTNFFQADEKNLQQILKRLNDITDDSAHKPEEKEGFKEIYEQQIHRFFGGAAVAFLNVYAGDLEAARKLALEELQITLDVINFYALSFYSDDLRVRTFLPGDAVGTQSLNIAFVGEENLNLEFPSHGPLVNFSLSLLDEEHSKQLGLTRLEKILVNSVRSEIEKRLLAAVRIAGKAVSSIRREDAFLLYAIALESILVGGKEDKDLTYLLSTRSAHLLGKDLEKRKVIKKEIADLYGIRSAIVHQGENNFADKYFFKIRRYTRNILVTLLTKDEFKEFKKKEELNQWFDDRMLS